MNNLSPKDLELIERIVYKNNDDVAISIARSFERLEERLDGTEARIHSRLSELEDRLDSAINTLDDPEENKKHVRLIVELSEKVIALEAKILEANPTK
jgi:hypothetical protein